MRIAVTGPPGAGKTYTFPSFTHADDLLLDDMKFQGHLNAVLMYMNSTPDYKIEGVMVTYALKHVIPAPDIIYRLEQPYEAPQSSHVKGLATAESNRFYAYLMENPEVQVRYITSGENYDNE